MSSGVSGRWQRLAFLCGACPFYGCSAFAFDFSAPLQNVSVSLNGSTVTYSITDPVRGLKSESVTTPGVVSTPEPAGGVVAWLAGATVYYRIYDPTRGLWAGGSANTPAVFVSQPVNASGVVAWNADTTVYARVYDPARGLWVAHATVSSGFVNAVRNAEGVVAWASGNSAFYRTFDPFVGQWRGGSVSSPGAPSISDLTDADGVVAWSAGGTVYCRVYDPVSGGWKNADVAVTGFVSGLTIANATVSWTAGSTSFTRGYNRTTGAWFNGQTLPRATFALSTNSANAPLTIWFTDLSLAGSSWSWNFGDGATASGLRTPYHTYTNFGRFMATQSISGPAGSHSTNRPVLTDVTAPTGSILINGGAAFTRSTNVTLHLTATDNSGVVALMRFSNSLTSWSAWEAFNTNKAWTLTASDGPKTVHAQFRDGADNVSVTVSDAITLDSRAPPVAAFSTNNFAVAENAGSVTITVSLSASTVFTAAVSYATSDGTASAGGDYAAASGRLVFRPGETTKTFTLFVTNDTRVEVNETILLALSDPTNCTVGSPGTVTILDDDPPAVGFASSQFSTNEDAGLAVITALLSAASGRTVTVQYATRNGTALDGKDYFAESNALVFPPGLTNRSFAVPLINDGLDEPEETVLLAVFSSTNATLGALSNAVLNIIDDDPPTASFASSLFFTNETAGQAVLTVRLSSPFHLPVQVDYESSNGSALAGADYVGANGTLTFNVGQTNRTFTLTILQDGAAEPIETVNLTLTGFLNATPGPVPQATLLIVDDASAPALYGPQLLPDGAFQFNLLGPAGRQYAIEASSNLTSWPELAWLTNASLSVGFHDSTATNATRRFYRARQLP